MMRRTKTVYQSEEVKQLEEQLKEAKKKAMTDKKKEVAEQTLKDVVSEFQQNKDMANDLDSVYQLSKHVFFQVNGARRVLKNE